MTKRSKSKFPALEKGLNLKSRADYIECSYIDGVYDKDGRQVIRPLTDKEKSFLNKFYEETVVTNFLHDDRLVDLNNKKKQLLSSKQYEKLKDQIKDAKERKDKKEVLRLSKIAKLVKEQNSDIKELELATIERKSKKIRKEVLLYPDKEQHKEFYRDNNIRNSCIYNMSKIQDKLDNIDDHNKSEYNISTVEELDPETILELLEESKKL